MITLRRFRAMIDSYGAHFHLWPKKGRSEIPYLLAKSADARAKLEEGQQLDEVIASASAHEDAMLWPPGEQDAALARLRQGVAARIVQQQTIGGKQKAGDDADWLAYFRFRWLGMAVGGGFAVTAGLVIGLTVATGSVPAPETDTVLAMLQSAPISVIADFGDEDGS